MSACAGATDPSATTRAPDLPVALISAPVNDTRQTQLILASADGRTVRTVPTFSGPKANVLWSPDGKRLAFTGSTVPSATYASGFDLHVINADGTRLQQLTTDQATGRFVWLPDGRILRLDPIPNVVPAGAGGALPVMTYAGSVVTALSLSADGAHVAFVSTRDTSGAVTSSQVYAAAFDGTGVRRLGPGFGPRISPAGDRVAYSGTQSTLSSTLANVVIARADGTGTPVQLAAVGVFALTWSRDGSRIAAVMPQNGYTRAFSIPADGSGAATPVVMRAAGATDFDQSVDWRPTTAP